MLAVHTSNVQRAKCPLTDSASTRAPAAPLVAMPTHLVGVLEFKVDHALANGVEAIELLRAPMCGQSVWKSVGQCAAGQSSASKLVPVMGRLTQQAPSRNLTFSNPAGKRRNPVPAPPQGRGLPHTFGHTLCPLPPSLTSLSSSSCGCSLSVPLSSVPTPTQLPNPPYICFPTLPTPLVPHSCGSPRCGTGFWCPHQA